MHLRMFRLTHPEGADCSLGGTLRCEKFWTLHFRRNACYVALSIIQPQRFPDPIAQPARKSCVHSRSIAAYAVARRLACIPCQKTDVLTAAIATFGSNP